MKDELLISCQQDRKSGFTRQLNRAYTLPDDVDKSTLTWDVKPNGILAISAQKIHK